MNAAAQISAVSTKLPIVTSQPFANELAWLVAKANVLQQMAHAVEQMKRQRPGPAEQQDQTDPRSAERAHVRERFGAAREREQCPHDQIQCPVREKCPVPRCTIDVTIWICQR